MNTKRSLKQILLIICSVVFLSNVYQAKAAGSNVSEAPLNTDFLNAINNKSDCKGAIPSSITIKSNSIHGIKGLSNEIALPAKYDLRNIGKVTSVKNQGTSQQSWAFSEIASLESNLMPNENEDFSERNMAVYGNNMFDYGYQRGGNRDMQSAYLASWAGPVYEQNDPFIPPIDAAGTLNMQAVNVSKQAKHVQEILYIPDRNSSLDNDKIKQAIMKYGAVSSLMYFDSDYYDLYNSTYYYNGEPSKNHFVTIVGWDDNFPATKFNNTPAGNGAFIVKGSWGKWFGDNGYCYVSYYDTAFGKDNTVVNGIESPNNYDEIYQYDPLGCDNYVGTGNDDTEWAANVFTSKHDNEKLAAASFYTLTEGSSYEIYVNGNYNNGGLSNLKFVKSGTIDSAGYHTIKFDNPINLTNGNKFAVAVKITSPGCNYPIADEKPITDRTSKATANAGESFVSSDGTSWDDILEYIPNANVCIKAFTTISHPDSESKITDFKIKAHDNQGNVLQDIIGDVDEDYNWIDVQIPYGVDEDLLKPSIETSTPVTGTDIQGSHVNVVAKDGVSKKSYYLNVMKYTPRFYKIKAGDYTLNVLAPQSTGNDDIYMIGEFNSWGLKTGDPIGTIHPELISNYKLIKQPDGSYAINGTISAKDKYKFVRGTSWSYVEDTIDAVSMPNRVVGNEKNQYLLIDKWVDKPDDLSITDGTMYCNSESAPNSVIINNKAYNVRYLFNSNNTTEIGDDLKSGNNIYYCLPAADSSVNKWTNLLNGSVLNTLEKEDLNVLDYKDNHGNDIFFK